MLNKKALIFGISGQDGKLLTKLLLSKNYEVFGVTRDVSITSKLFKSLDSELSRIELFELSEKEFNKVSNLIKKINPIEIYNLSGVSSPAFSINEPVQTFRSIVDLNIHILEELKLLSNIRYFNACSSECFGDTGSKKADEGYRFNPITPYGKAKTTAFWLLDMYRKKFKIHASSGLLFNHESVLRSDNFVSKKIINTAKKIHNGIDLKLKLGNINVTRDWGWAPEYVYAMWLMTQQDVPDDYVVATGKSHSLKTFVEKVFLRFGLKFSQHVHIEKKLFRKNEIINSNADPRKAYKKLNWKALTTFDQLIDKLIADDKN